MIDRKPTALLSSTYDPKNPNVKKLQQQHGTNWKQKMWEMGGGKGQHNVTQLKTAYDAGVKLAMHEEETKGSSFSWGKAALPIASILGGILLGRGLGGKIGSALGYGLSKGKIGPTLAGESAGRFAGGTAGGLAGLFGSAALVQRGQQGGESQTPPFNSSDFREGLRLNPKSPELDEAFGMYQQDTGNQIGQMSQQDINDYIRQIRGLSAGQY